MKNIDYDSILSGFQRKRLENEILADNRKAEIYEKIPEIKKIDQEIASSSIDITPPLQSRHNQSGYSSPHTAGKQHPSSHTDNVLRGDAPEPAPVHTQRFRSAHTPAFPQDHPERHG